MEWHAEDHVTRLGGDSLATGEPEVPARRACRAVGRGSSSMYLCARVVEVVTTAPMGAESAR
jgi:hypothetical protein